MDTFVDIHFGRHVAILILPHLMFWILLLVGASELSLRAMLTCIGIWLFLVLLAVIFMLIGASGDSVLCILAGIQAVFDVVLILMTFGGDIRLR